MPLLCWSFCCFAGFFVLQFPDGELFVIFSKKQRGLLVEKTVRVFYFLTIS
jgi:hypothetical protein